MLAVIAAAVVHAEFFVSLPFLLEGCPSRDFPGASLGRCKISCTSPANDAAGEDASGFTAAVALGAAAPDAAEKMFGLGLDTGCMLGG